jgi:WD40 repeat protein
MNRVFISYSRKNQRVAERLARDLGDAGLDVWIDLSQIHGGELWREEIFKGIDRADFVIACISPDSLLSQWCEREILTAREQGKPICPIMIEEALAQVQASSTLAWLADVQFVNFIDRYEEAFPQLLESLPGGRALNTFDDFDAATIPNPFKGLEAFQQRDAAFFFGREELTRKAIQRLRRASFLAVVGASGSGKSSLVRAGVIPQMRSGVIDSSEQWPILIFTPGVHPIEALARRIFPLYPATDTLTVADLQARLRTSGNILELVNQLLANSPDETALLLVIDQFEEVFTRTGETERAQFLDVIRVLATMGQQRTRIIITMRADFFGNLSQYPDLASLFEDDNLLIATEMTTANLLRAIEGPAQAVGLRYEQGLVDQILEDVKSEPGSLPLLQYALRELYKRRDGAKLTLDAYETIGGVQQALARHAEVIFQALNVKQQDIMRRLLLRLVEVGETGDATRRRVPRDEVTVRDVASEDVQDVIDELTAPDARLLIANREISASADEPITHLQVSHEALITQWDRFETWVRASLDDLRYESELRKSAENWDSNARDEAYLLRGRRLQRAELWMDDHPVTPIQQAFIEASLATERKRQEEEDIRLQRELELQRAATRRLLLFVGVLVIGIVLAIGAFIVQTRTNNQLAQTNDALANTQRDLEAERDRAETNANRAETNAARARLLAISANARQIALDNDGDLALALAVSAAQTANPPAPVQRDLATIALAPGTRWRIDTMETVTAAIYHPAGGQIAIGTDRGVVRLLRVDDGQELRSWAAHRGAVTELLFTLDGTRLITAAAQTQRNLIVWDIASGDRVAELDGHTDTVNDMALMQDGTLVTVSDDRSVIIWDMTTPQPVIFRRISPEIDADGAHTTPVTAVAVHPTLSYIVTGSDNTLLMHRADGKFEWKTAYRGGSDPVNAIAFDATGKQLIVGFTGGAIVLTDISTGDIILNFAPLPAPVVDLKFYPDGQFFLTAGAEATLRLWDVRLERQVNAFDIDAPISTLALSPDGTTAITGIANSTLRLWELTGSAEVARTDSTQVTTNIALSADETTAAVGTHTGAVILYDVAQASEIRRVPVIADVRLQSLAFSPDGALLAVGDEDGRVTLIDLSDDRTIYSIRGHEAIVNAVLFTNAGDQLITAASDGSIVVRATADGTVTTTISSFDSSLTDLAIDDADSRLIASSTDGSLILWELPSGEPIALLSGHTAAVMTVAISGDGRRALSGAQDGDNTVRLWNLETLREALRFEGHEDTVSSVDFLLDVGVVSASHDGTIRLWDIATGAETRRYEARSDAGRVIRVLTMAVKADGSLAGAAMGDRTLRLWQLFPTVDALLAWTTANRFVPELDCNESLRFDIASNPDFNLFGEQRFVTAPNSFVTMRAESDDSSYSVGLLKDRAAVRLLSAEVNAEGQPYYRVCNAEGTEGWIPVSSVNE